MVRDAYTKVDKNKDTITLVAGDSDYVPAVELLTDDGFRVEVHALEARLGGTLHYDMIADSPEMIAAMKQMGRPTSHEARAVHRHQAA